MAYCWDIGNRVQAVDEIGRWCNGRVIESDGLRFKVRFQGYGPEYDRVVGKLEIRERISSPVDISCGKFCVCVCSHCCLHYFILISHVLFNVSALFDSDCCSI